MEHITMKEDVARRALAFVNTVAGRCSSCLKRNGENCGRCLAAWANEIMGDYEKGFSAAATGGEIDYSLAARMACIVSAIDKAGRPLRSREIDLDGICSWQLKWWTLRRMVRTGMLVRECAATANGSEWVYSVPKDGAGRGKGGRR